MGVFDNLSKVKVQQKAAYFEPGSYIVEINEVAYLTGYKGETLKIACTITDSVAREDIQASPVGNRCAQFQKMDGQRREQGLSTFMGFLCAVYECSPEDKTDKQWKKIAKAVIDDNTLEGILMRLDCFRIIIESTGNPFTIHQWQYPVEVETFDESEEQQS